MSYSDDTAAFFFGGGFTVKQLAEEATERRKGAGGEVGLPSAVAMTIGIDIDMDRCPTCETRTLHVIDVVVPLDGDAYWRMLCTTCELYVYRYELDELPEAPHTMSTTDFAAGRFTWRDGATCPACDSPLMRLDVTEVDITKVDVTYWRIQCTTCELNVELEERPDRTEAPTKRWQHTVNTHELRHEH